MYDILKTFEENINAGPPKNFDFPIIKKSNKKYDFLGHKLNSLFGVSASPLTHGSRNVAFYSRLGYDILTYRSVRSTEWKGQNYPHWRYVSITKQLTPEGLSASVHGSDRPFPKQEISTANSFGIQSSKPKEWQADFEVAKKLLEPNQLLILSLMFTPETGQDVIKDAGIVASYGNETSADVFEINLAHPNSGMKSLVYEDLDTSLAICEKVKKIIDDRPLLAKVGYYKNPETLKDFMGKSAGIIDGITSTNTYSMSVIDKENNPVFPGRSKAGVSGGAVRNLSQEQVRKLVEIKDVLQLKDFVIIGVGGVLVPDHINKYLEIGADAVQAVVGVWADPYLAAKYKNG